MTEQSLQNDMQQEQFARIVTVMEAIMVMIFAFITAAALPQILYQYVIATGSVDPNNAVFQNFTLIVYVVAAASVLIALVMNFMRSRKINQMKSDMELMQYVAPVSMDDGSDDLALAMEEIEASTGSSAKKSRARKPRRAAASSTQTSRSSRKARKTTGRARRSTK